MIELRAPAASCHSFGYEARVAFQTCRRSSIRCSKNRVKPLGGGGRRRIVAGAPRMLLGDTAPRSLAAGAAWCLLDEAVLGQRAEMERGVGRRLAEGLAGLGGRHRAVPAEQLEQGDPHRVGKGAHLPGIGELTLRSKRLAQRGSPLPNGARRR